jgi:cyclohexanone monooxygenase
MHGTSWERSNNYFKAPTGKIVTQWPIGCVAYRLLTKLLGRISETTSLRSGVEGAA